jgi:hypothetical protein
MRDPDLVKVTELFLIPSSFLVAALGTADTNPHRCAVSLLGLIISLMWLVCSREALREHEAGGSGKRSVRTRVLSGLATFFVSGWLASAIVHGALWNRPLGG